MNTNQDALKIEEHLESLLHPVVPKKDFVSNLQDRLRKNTAIAIERTDYLVLILLILSGLIFGAILFWMIKWVVTIVTKGSR
jgi:hypothetical protein